MSTRIELKNIVKRFANHEVIHGIDLAIEPGDFAVFVGPSGCGKSTLLRMIAGLEDISGGELLIDGTTMNEVPPSKRGIAMVFQSYALYPHMTVYKNLAFGLETAGYKRPEIGQRVKRAAETLKIDALLSRRPKALSGGQRQRVAIGRAIVRDPRIFLFDEPLSNLDAELRVQMRVEISKLHQELGNTMIYVTHDQVEAMTMATKIVVLRDGQIMQVGSPLELYNNPMNIFVAGFIGSPKMNFIKCRWSAGDRGVVLQESFVPFHELGDATGANSPVTLGVRPEHLVIGGDAGHLLGYLKVALVEQLGGATVVYGETSVAETVTVMIPGQVTVATGDLVPLRFNAAHGHLFGEDGNAIRRPH